MKVFRQFSKKSIVLSGEVTCNKQTASNSIPSFLKKFRACCITDSVELLSSAKLFGLIKGTSNPSFCEISAIFGSSVLTITLSKNVDFKTISEV